MISLVTRMATFLYGAPNGSTLPLIPGSAIPYLYYTDPVGAVDPLGHPVTPTTVIDITDQLDKKVEMLACHASQRDWLRAHHHMDEYIESMKCAAADKRECSASPRPKASSSTVATPIPKMTCSNHCWVDRAMASSCKIDCA